MKFKLVLVFACCYVQFLLGQTMNNQSDTYPELVRLFKSWRSFETPPLFNGAPDYRDQTFAKRRPVFEGLRKALQAVDTTGWAIAQKADYMIVWAEMNGYDFNERVLQPWKRDPAFYKTVWSYRSDVPAHEGPTHHATLELWTYSFPLSSKARTKIISSLKMIPVLHEQAKINLTGNAKDLWITGIRDLKTQASVLKELQQRSELATDKEIQQVLTASIQSTESFSNWLEEKSSTKTGPSGIGKENYSWYLKNVHLVPLTWEDEVLLLKRELARAWTALKLEEHRNRKLPELTAANTAAAFDSLAKKSAKDLLAFLEQQDIVTVKPYFKPALDAHLGSFVPEAQRNFFVIGMHYDPRPLYSHFYHWFELARMDNEPHQSTIRRSPLLYNIFDSRNEGTATAVEEMFMQAGLYDTDPRVREIVYIMIAQRAARGLGSLYAHANQMSMEEAGSIHSEYTPRGWMKTEKELLIFEQHLYLRQPGYGTSYITGKYLLEEALAGFAKKQEDDNKTFVPKDFFDALNKMGNIPITLAHWQLIGENPLLKPY